MSLLKDLRELSKITFLRLVEFINQIIKVYETFLKNLGKTIFSFIGIILIILLAIFYSEHYGSLNSVQLIIILVGIIIVNIFLWARDYLFPNFSNLSKDAARIYYSSALTIILGIFASFGIAFSILWGSLYTYSLETRNVDFLNTLKIQGFMLLFFLIYATVIVFVMFILPLQKKIGSF